MLAAVVLGIWLAGVLFVAAHHEFWRDEVRALSLARSAVFPWDLLTVTRDEGHPLLWYLLLYLGSKITASSLVLPAVSIAVAFAAVLLFVLWSPFPFWMRSLFLFGALPLYDYSVLARNYGLSMLLLFVCAPLYKERFRHPWMLASAIALLANTNVLSILLALILTALWASDLLIESRGERRSGSAPATAAAFAILAAGLLLAVAASRPDQYSIVATTRFLTAEHLASAVVRTLLHPGELFWALGWTGSPAWVAGGLIWIALLGLAARPRFLVAGIAALFALGVFFQTFYQGMYQTQGLLLVFVVALYWMLVENVDVRAFRTFQRRLFQSGFYGAMSVAFLVQIANAKSFVELDLRSEATSAEAFGNFLRTSQAYRNAILVAEPDYMAESIPYYADNPIYIAREHRYGTTVSFTTASDRSESLGQLLAVARRLKADTGRPVLIVFGHRGLSGEKGETVFSYDKLFTWDAEDVQAFHDGTVLVAGYSSSYGDENYLVYEVR